MIMNLHTFHTYVLCMYIYEYMCMCEHVCTEARIGCWLLWYVTIFELNHCHLGEFSCGSLAKDRPSQAC